MSIIGWIVLGLIAGFIASKVVNKAARIRNPASSSRILDRAASRAVRRGSPASSRATRIAN